MQRRKGREYRRQRHEEADSLDQVSQSRVQEAQAAIQTARAKINSLNTLIALYNTQEQELNLTSPIDGVILTLNTDVLEGQSFAKGEVIATVGDLSKVKIQIQLPEKEIAYIEQDNQVTVRAIGVPNEVFTGKISQIAPITSEIEEQTNTRRIFEVTIILDNQEKLLKPGMTGYAVIKTNKTKSLAGMAWDEIYYTFKLSRYINKNII